ncbi:MAG: 2-oxoacid:acceptor oxidoreductase [Spirochaetia bacterium]|nr:2-oxoacid:acceptor oxidoreductase [Spirochaetia bacterium]NCC90068.1 2-oxoacid:acceptor oxidoreductase [Spirochaetia bacterium]
MSRRNDAVRVYDLAPYKQIFPYIMPKRCESLVYQNMVLDLTGTVEFIKHNKTPQGRSYRVFEVFLAALLRTITLRPELNRFVSHYQHWQRKDLSINFVVKEDYSDESPEHSMPLYFREDMTLDEISAIINAAIEEQRKPASSNFTDKAILFFLKFPRPIIRLVVGAASLLDRHGKAPKALRDADGLHTSLFVSNMGSIGLGGGSPHHHLYEWGTTSVFVTMGVLKRSHHQEGGRLMRRDTMEVGFTVDERITDGFYFTKSIKLFQDLLANPEVLLSRAEVPPRPMSKREYKRSRKASAQTTPKNDR